MREMANVVFSANVSTRFQGSETKFALQPKHLLDLFVCLFVWVFVVELPICLKREK